MRKRVESVESAGRAKRILAATVLLSLLACFALSSLFIVTHAGPHACSGTQCPICAQLEACAAALRNLAMGGAALVFAAAALLVWTTVRPAATGLWIAATPVSLKIRLNN